MGNYKELLVWKEARALTHMIYDLVRFFPQEEIYCLSAQMRRAVVSIGSNIAEGAGRGSTKDYLHFLYIARGSAYELETQLVYCDDLDFMGKEFSKNLHDQVSKVIYLLNRLINALKKNIQYQINEEVTPYGASEE